MQRPVGGVEIFGKGFGLVQVCGQTGKVVAFKERDKYPRYLIHQATVRWKVDKSPLQPTVIRRRALILHYVSSKRCSYCWISHCKVENRSTLRVVGIFSMG